MMPAPPSGLDQLRRAERCGDGVGIAGARKDIYGGVGELDHIRVPVLDVPEDRTRLAPFPGRSQSSRAAARVDPDAP